MALPFLCETGKGHHTLPGSGLLPNHAPGPDEPDIDPQTLRAGVI